MCLLFILLFYIYRIKTVKSITVNDELFLITASSDGQVKVWHTDASNVSCL